MPTRRRPSPVRWGSPPGRTGPFCLQRLTMLEDQTSGTRTKTLKVKVPTPLPLGQAVRPLVRFVFFFHIRLTSAHTSMVLKRDSMEKYAAPQIIDSIVTSSSRRSRDWFLLSKLRTSHGCHGEMAFLKALSSRFCCLR